jgi:hypothetical protein
MSFRYALQVFLRFPLSHIKRVISPPPLSGLLRGLTRTMPYRRDRDAYISGAMDDAMEEDNDKLASSIAEKVKKLKERSYDLGM